MRQTLIIFLFLACVYSRATDKPVAPDFSKYPQAKSLDYYLSVHTNSAWNLQHTNLIVISSFPSGGSYALQYFVTESGQELDHRNVYSWAIQASHSKQLSETNLMGLRSAINDLPVDSVSPPIERLVIVSFHKNTNWLTRTYDSAALPKPMRQIYEIVGERFESKKSKGH